MIHNSLRLKRQEDIYKPRKTDSFCENFLIWISLLKHSDFDGPILYEGLWFIIYEMTQKACEYIFHLMAYAFF